MDTRRQAIQISEDLKGVNNSDSLIHNIEQVCDYVIDAIESITGSQRHLRTDHENTTIDFWKEVKREAKNIYNQ